MIDRLLIVGLGSIGKRHARLARQMIPGVQIAALRHRGCDDPAAEGLDLCTTSLQEALAFQPHAAVIASPAPRHLETALPLATAGTHLLVEKPISDRADGVADLVAACRKRGVVLMTGYNLRFLPSLRLFRELVTSGSMGRILSVRCEIGQYLPAWRPGADYRTSVSARAELGGGVLLELSHELDYLRWIFGEVRWVSAVQARQSSLEIDVEDVAVLTLGLASNGAQLTIATVSMDFFRHDTTRSCTAIGEAGTLRWDAVAGTVEQYVPGEGASWRTLSSGLPGRDETYIAEWREFLNRIADRGVPAVSGEDGLAVLEIVEAARASARRGVVVPLTNS